MQIPLQITFHGIDHSDAIEERVREKVAKLEQYCDRITGCKVVIEAHHHNAGVKTKPFHVRLSLQVPGEDLVVNRDPKDSHEHEELTVALRDAFQALERQVKDYVARSREDVKVRA